MIITYNIFNYMHMNTIHDLNGTIMYIHTQCHVVTLFAVYNGVSKYG